MSIFISKNLEKEYFNKFINKEVEFLPEVYKEGYIIGHTGNYLLVKTKGSIDDLNEIKKVKIEKIEYRKFINLLFHICLIFQESPSNHHLKGKFFLLQKLILNHPDLVAGDRLCELHA